MASDLLVHLEASSKMGNAAGVGTVSTSMNM